MGEMKKNIIKHFIAAFHDPDFWMSRYGLIAIIAIIIELIIIKNIILM